MSLDNSGWLNPGTVVNFANDGPAWTNPSNAGDGDAGTAASVSLSKNQIADHLRATNFTFPSIPSGATLVGVEFRVKRQRTSGTGSQTDSDAGTVSATTDSGNIADPTNWQNTSLTIYYGGPNDTLNVVEADLDSSFGFEVAPQTGSTTATLAIQYIQCRIHWYFANGVGVNSVAADTSGTGSKTFDVSVQVGGSTTAKAAILAAARSTILDTENGSDGSVGVGVWAGTEEGYISAKFNSPDTTFAKSYHDHGTGSDVIGLVETGGTATTPDLVYDLPADSSGDLQINRSSGATNSAANLMSAFVLSDTVVSNASSGVFTGGAASNDKAITGLGFQPDFVVIMTTYGTSNATAQDHFIQSVGFAADSPSGDIEQGVMSLYGTHNWDKPGEGANAPVDYGGSSSHFAYHPNDGSTGRTVLMKSFDAGGFTVTHGSLSDTSARYIYLAVKLNSGYSSSVTRMDYSSSALRVGTHDITVDANGGVPIGAVIAWVYPGTGENLTWGVSFSTELFQRNAFARLDGTVFETSSSEMASNIGDPLNNVINLDSFSANTVTIDKVSGAEYWDASMLVISEDAASTDDITVNFINT